MSPQLGRTGPSINTTSEPLHSFMAELQPALRSPPWISGTAVSQMNGPLVNFMAAQGEHERTKAASPASTEPLGAERVAPITP
ncbi:hypothetical protein JOQ06_027929 [Pogonophryne albipinna]|uniref:Uncharacterized protein n=1 Tax=Pogonophryne albipinna TaxID=1090488 RepID=A0AAD6ACM5_9TELE|nr:hypothetical protein JOQ06_027929 [Pogonophryne albipinna]